MFNDPFQAYRVLGYVMVNTIITDVWNSWWEETQSSRYKN